MTNCYVHVLVIESNVLVLGYLVLIIVLILTENSNFCENIADILQL